MPWGHQKSGTAICFDIVRHLLILSGTCYVLFSIWKPNWIFAVIATIPVYVVALNLFGFLTLPLYYFTPENRLRAKAFKGFQSGDLGGKARTDKFMEEFNVNAPKKESPSNEDPKM